MPDVSAEWRELLCSLPGYNPFADCEGCWFDPALAQRSIDFIHRFIKHGEGDLAGKPFLLERWQKAVLANLFGWLCKDEMGRVVRRYRACFIYVARKNGKTPFVAAIALYVLFCDDEWGQQNYIAASKRSQAGKLFQQCKRMVALAPALDSRCRVYGGKAEAGQMRSIVREATSSYLQVLGGSSAGEHGGNSHLVIVDELHEQKTRELIDTLDTSMASSNRKQPLTIFTTTADYLRPSICNEKYDHAKLVLTGKRKDPRFLPVIYEADPEDDYLDPATWAKANPNLGVSVSREYLRSMAEYARVNPAFRNEYRRLHHNVRTRSETLAIPTEKWSACGFHADPVVWRAEQLAALKGLPCIGGLDLASTNDLTALVLLFWWQGKPIKVLPWFWLPSVTREIRSREQGVPYSTWADMGFVECTDGDRTDYDVLRQRIWDISQLFDLRELAVDPKFQGAQLCNQLAGDGIEIVEFGQGFNAMSAPTKILLEMVSGGEWDHGNNPVLEWMAGNAQTVADGEGGVKFSKKKSAEKIDGIVAMAMALGRAMVAKDGRSVYDQQGIDSF